MNSNISRPIPRADTGSRFLNWVSGTTMFLLQMERRIDPWLRPIFDAALRDPVARLVTALMNKHRKDDGLKIAEEKLLPNEEEYLNSVIESFTTQMRGLWKPGGFERGGNTKTQGIVRGEFIVHDNLPPQFRYGIYAKPQTFRCWVRCPTCQTINAIDLRKLDRHDDAAVTTRIVVQVMPTERAVRRTRAPVADEHRRR